MLLTGVGAVCKNRRDFIVNQRRKYIGIMHVAAGKVYGFDEAIFIYTRARFKRIDAFALIINCSFNISASFFILDVVPTLLLRRARCASATLASIMLTVPCLISKSYSESCTFISRSNGCIKPALPSASLKRQIALWSGMWSDIDNPVKHLNIKSRASSFSNAGSLKPYQV